MSEQVEHSHRRAASSLHERDTLPAATESVFCPHNGVMERPAAGGPTTEGPMTAALMKRVHGHVLGKAAVALATLWGVYAWFALSDEGTSWVPIAVASGAILGLTLMSGAACRVASGHDKRARRATQLGVYKLGEAIGQGGMGQVFRAEHAMLARPAAIKLIRHADGKAADETARRRFEREAQVTAALSSPHTVELYDFGVTDAGDFYFVMELLEGLDLEQLVRRHGPLPPARVVHILRQVLDSLAEAHSLGLVHRDVKPANILLSRRGLDHDYVKVLDFGLVKSVDRQSIQLTADDRISGTPAYLAPEVVSGKGTVDGRADLYALGAVAYYLLTGELVFDAESPMAMAVKHVTERPLAPSLRSGRVLPEALEELVMACLEKDPADRPRSALALADELSALDLGSWDREDARSWWRAHAPRTATPAPDAGALAAA